jgi:putative sigma-54 modulation protein
MPGPEMETMNIEYVGRNYDIEERVRRFAEGKLSKLDKFLQEPVEIRVTLETEKHRQIADVHVAHRHGVLQATEDTADMYDAINTAVDKVEKQARRSKKKHEGKRRRNNGQVWPLTVLARESVGGGATPRIVKSTQLEIKPMTVDEAALQLEQGKNEFVVFRDSTSDQVSVLYKRRDNNYGLIAPEF